MVTIHKNEGLIKKFITFLKENWLGIVAILLLLFVVFFTFGIRR